MAPVKDAISSALSGIQQGLKSASERAERISNFSSNPDSESFTSDLVGLKLDLYQVRANKKVMKTVQEIDKNVLDILA